MRLQVHTHMLLWIGKHEQIDIFSIVLVDNAVVLISAKEDTTS